MSQVDTGLGWSANGTYLRETAGLVGGIETISMAGASNQPIPYLDIEHPTAADVYAAGFAFGDLISGNTRIRKYVAVHKATTENNVMFCCFWDTSGLPAFISTSQIAQYSIASYDLNTDSITLDGDYGFSGAYDSVTGLYYARQSSGQIVNQNFQVPVFSSVREALDSITVSSTPFYKLNSGYAVVAFIKWRDFAPATYWTPFLISTDESAVKISINGTDEYSGAARALKLFDGLTFYISYVRGVSGDPNTTYPTFDANAEFIGPGGESLSLNNVFAMLVSADHANVLVINSPDPYQEGDGSEEGGGDGDDIQNDDIDFTPAPTSMAVASGFITLFCPSQAELNALADYMWSPLFDVDTLKKLFANPMDCILGLSVIPVPVVPEGTKTVKVGGVSTTVSMGYTNHQYYPVDCGTVTIPKRWGAYMDYTPYTKLNIFLPYIGFRQISADDVMGKTLHLRYMIDILSGACNAELKVNNTVLYSWAGSCAMQIPITGNDWRSAITAGVSIAGSVAATVLSGGASAPMIAGTVASATVNSLALKPEVQRSGSLSSASGFLAAQRPYIVRTNPRNAIPANQNKYSGYPSFVTVSLGSLTGYNEVYSVHLENIPATGAELDEIETILKGGAIF